MLASNLGQGRGDPALTPGVADVRARLAVGEHRSRGALAIAPRTARNADHIRRASAAPDVTVAACTPRRMLFSDDLEARGPEDPPKHLVCATCLDAGVLLNGLRRGPYRDDDARALVDLC